MLLGGSSAFMKKLHFAFVVSPFNTNVNPTLPIVSVLVRRGHRVTYVTSDRLAPRITALGAEVRRYPAGVDGFIAPEKMESFVADTMSALTTHYQADRPSLLVCEFFAFVGRLLANKLNIPAIQMGPHYSLDRQNFEQQIRDAKFREEIIKGSRIIDETMARYKVTEGEFIFHRAKLNIYLFPKCFQPKGSAIHDSRSFYAGRCAGEQLAFGHWSGRHSARPIVLVATSMSYVRGKDYFRMCVDALSNLEWQVVLSIGDNDDPAQLGPLPPNFEIVQKTSHTKILPYADLLVYMGGTVSAAESMYHGVPLVMTSCGLPELEWLADNLADLGLGVHLRDADTNVETLRRAVVETSGNADVLRNVKQMQRRVRKSPGAEEVANLIEGFMEQEA